MLKGLLSHKKVLEKIREIELNSLVTSDKITAFMKAFSVLCTPDITLAHQQCEHCYRAAQAATATEMKILSDYGRLSSRHCQILVN